MKADIRPARIDELVTLQGVARQTIDASYRSFLGDEEVDSFIDSGEADRYVRENLGDCLVLIVREKIVGFCVCKDDLIDLLMIDPEFHRRGLGTRLLDHCQKTLFREFHEITLETFEGNDRALAFYRQNGWVEKKRRYDKASGSTKVVMVKTSG